MSFFRNNYRFLTFPLEADGKAGFRLAQRGALFAIGAHFSERTEPAIVTMPTGSGKTAVLQAVPLLLQATRVLVLTPGRLVREQIADDFRVMGVLRKLGGLPIIGANPKIISNNKMITSNEDWEALRHFDAVVATVSSISPHLDFVPIPPPDLFDLILVDEAHHSPAASWTSVLEHFEDAKKVLFTATPFRRDNKEIKGRFVYTYDLRRAYDEGVFGKISYEQVEDPDAGDNLKQREDIAIAKAAEARLNSDREQNFDHLIMVRTDSRERAKELADIYSANTALRLRIIQGNHSLKHVRAVLDQLSRNELDGIICVNMLGEGFDLPRLKVAAVHSPHRSLAVTLQFIGRFARTTGMNLGGATFVALRSEIQLEAEALYSNGAVWSELVPNLSRDRVEKEVSFRETIQSFEQPEQFRSSVGDLSLYSLYPYAHLKIYATRGDVDISATPDFGPDKEIVYTSVSRDNSSSVFITKRSDRVDWSSDDSLINIRYDLFIIYFDAPSSLLFICASDRVDGLYRRIAASICGDEPRILSLISLNRALRELQQARFFNVGMRNRQYASQTETYRMITGSNADRAIRKEDSKLFHRGHCFGTAIENGIKITIGLSSASKIWSNTSLNISSLISWCQKIAGKISDTTVAVTGSGLDLLDMGIEIAALDARALYADWDKDLYSDVPQASFQGSWADPKSLTYFDLKVEDSDEQGALISFSDDQHRTLIRYQVSGEPFFSYDAENVSSVELVRGRRAQDLCDYLNDNPLSIYLEDWSRLCGNELFKFDFEGFTSFESDRAHPVDWRGEGIDITLECKTLGRSESIQEYLARVLDSEEHDLVYWDHGSGEAADFIVLQRTLDGGVHVNLYHCKGAGGNAPGNRVDDVYEVCAQAVKACIWCDLPRLVSRTLDRHRRNIGVSKFIRGNADLLSQMSSLRPQTFGMTVVQPGISKGDIADKIGEILAAADSHLVRSGHAPLSVWSSP